jgi:hypothetical protein
MSTLYLRDTGGWLRIYGKTSMPILKPPEKEY